MINPGPFALMIRPSLNITPRSYSFKMRKAAERKKITRTIMATAVNNPGVNKLILSSFYRPFPKPVNYSQ
jgi:hypothetical protein